MKDEMMSTEVQKGMDCVVSMLQSNPQLSKMRFDDYHWEINTIPSVEKKYCLIVRGCHNRKAVKLFSVWELENCPYSKVLQEELQTRLLGLLTFIATP